MCSSLVIGFELLWDCVVSIIIIVLFCCVTFVGKQYIEKTLNIWIPLVKLVVLHKHNLIYYAMIN